MGTGTVYELQNKNCFQSTSEGLGIAGFADNKWESVPDFGCCNAEGSLTELKFLILAIIGYSAYWHGNASFS